MSVAAPTVVAEALSRQSGPWLGRIGLLAVVAGFIALATFVHQDQSSSYDVYWNPTRYAVPAAIVVLLVALAFTPLGRPLPGRERRVPPPWVLLLVGGVGMAAFDLVPMSWVGVAQDIGVFIIGLALIAWWARSPGWSMRHQAAVAFGALLTRTITGFLAPLPQDTTWLEKITQNVTYLVVILALGMLLWRRTDDPGNSEDGTG